MLSAAEPRCVRTHGGLSIGGCTRSKRCCVRGCGRIAAMRRVRGEAPDANRSACDTMWTRLASGRRWIATTATILKNGSPRRCKGRGTSRRTRKLSIQRPCRLPASWWAVRVGRALHVPRMPQAECTGRREHWLDFDPKALREWATEPLAV